MKFTSWLLSATVVAAVPSTRLEARQAEAGTGPNLTPAQEYGNLKKCPPGQMSSRQEWRAITTAQRKNYISAILCLQSSPSKLSPQYIGGAKTRFDDFQAIHMLQTPYIHQSATFLSWHRYFIHEYEQALQGCGYTGVLPYWDWTKDYDKPAGSPVFTGVSSEADSMSGNGVYVDYGYVNVTVDNQGDTVSFPQGTGGGCVYNGPFVNMTVNLGGTTPTNTTGYAYNPRCLKRDIRAYMSQTYNTPAAIKTLLSNFTDVESFQDALQGIGSSGLNPHGGGHFIYGMDPGSQINTSPGDPIFFLHHAQVDRLWTLWQNQDPTDRTFQIWGTNTQLNYPPSANVTLNDYLDFSVIGGKIQIRSLMATNGGPFCYNYE